MGVRTCTLNFDVMSDSLSSGMVGMYVSRPAPATVTFTGPGITRGALALVLVLSSERPVRPRTFVGGPAMFRCFDCVGSPDGYLDQF